MDRKIRVDCKQFQERINNYTMDVIVVPETYKGISKKCKFIDSEFGVFFRTPNNMLRGVYKRHPKFFNKVRNIKKALPFDKAYDLLLEKNIILDKSTYTSISQKCKMWEVGTESFFYSKPSCFIHGKQKGHPINSLKRIKDTCIKKYGVDNPLKNQNIRLKAAIKTNNTYLTYHWKTNKKLVCTGSYEYKVVTFLNKNKIDYVWQPITYKLESGKVYFPDLYIIDYLFNDRNYFVEIKGFFYPNSKLKWEEFKNKHTTSQLWDKLFLKENGIL